MGQESTEIIKERRIASVISHAAQKLGLSKLKRFSGGHMGVALFECENIDGTKQVVKLGYNQETNKEVSNNSQGYEAIAQTGARSILPGGIRYEEVEGDSLLVMDHVGKSFAERVRADESNLYGTFLSGMEAVYDEAIHLNTRHLHEAGVRQIRNELALWQQRLIDAGYLPKEATETSVGFSVADIAGSHSTLMLSDFTPDNIFLQDGQVRFIDPWLQDTYIGTPVPGLAQFITLAADVYHLPGATQRKGDFEDLAYRIGEKLGLTEKQVRNQLRLGKAMQLALSSFVRIGKDEAVARQFAIESYDTLKGLEK